VPKAQSICTMFLRCDRLNEYSGSRQLEEWPRPRRATVPASTLTFAFGVLKIPGLAHGNQPQESRKSARSEKQILGKTPSFPLQLPFVREGTRETRSQPTAWRTSPHGRYPSGAPDMHSIVVALAGLVSLGE